MILKAFLHLEQFGAMSLQHLLTSFPFRSVIFESDVFNPNKVRTQLAWNAKEKPFSNFTKVI